MTYLRAGISHNQLSAVYDYSTLCAVSAAMRMRMSLWLGDRQKTIASRVDYDARDFSDKARDCAKAFIAEFLPAGGLDTPLSEMDLTDTDERLFAAQKEAARQRREIEQQDQEFRMKRTFAAYGGAA